MSIFSVAGSTPSDDEFELKSVRWEPADNINFQHTLNKEQKQYKGALEECRQANKDFHVELINHILNTPQTFSVET